VAQPAWSADATTAVRGAPAASQVRIEDMTWPEIRDAVRAGRTTLIIPIGGTEQSGPYIAVGKHDVRAGVLSDRIAQTLGNALVAPVIAYVPEGSYAPPSSHMRFPGTITVPNDVFEKTLVAAANSFKVHGFTRIVFLGDHGGYEADVRKVVAQLNRDWAGGRARALAPDTYYRTSSEGFNAILRAKGFRDDEIGTHAGLADAALQLAVAPSMVRTEEMRGAPKPGVADGVYGGDPRRATAALGQLGIDAIIANTVAAIRQAQ
jgi:creatinine amidohydrolase/Fe(II)-dependent formamide hydrolase-like protein